MSIASGTTSTLLTNMKTLFLGYQNTTLSKIRTWQRGVLSPVAVFPALAILPVRDICIYGLSNGKYEVDHEISIQVYDFKLDAKQAYDNTVDLVKAIKDILESNHTIGDICYDSRWTNEEYGNTVMVTNKLHYLSSLSFIGRNRESFPTTTMETSITNDVNIKDLQDALKTIIRNNKSTYYNTVKSIKDTPITVTPELPAIFIGAGNKLRQQNFPQADMSKVYFEVAIFLL